MLDGWRYLHTFRPERGDSRGACVATDEVAGVPVSLRGLQGGVWCVVGLPPSCSRPCRGVVSAQHRCCPLSLAGPQLGTARSGCRQSISSFWKSRGYTDSDTTVSASNSGKLVWQKKHIKCKFAFFLYSIFSLFQIGIEALCDLFRGFFLFSVCFQDRK